MTMQQLWNHKWAITTGVPMSKEGLQKRTLVITDIGMFGGQEPVQARRHMVHSCSYSEKELFWEQFWEGTHSEKEALTSCEGYMGLDERGDPRLPRKPRHNRKQEKDILLMLWAQTLSDNGVLCPGHRVSKVPQLQPMLDPWVRSVYCLSLHITMLLVRAWAWAIVQWMFENSLCSHN